MKAEILTIGDEILRGEIVDSNKALIAERLLSLDVETHHQVSVRDDESDMRDAFQRAAARSDLVIVSGGLGPTRDDRTAEVLADTFGRKLALHQASLEAIREFFRRFGREMAETNVKQAWLPEGAEALENPIGTAPGFGLRQGRATFFCLPGVPRELARMLNEQVLPRVGSRGAGAAVVRAAILRTFGIGESDLEQALADVADDASVRIGFRTAFPDNYLRPVVRARTAEQAEALLARTCERIQQRLGPLVYGRGDETLEAVVGRMLRGAGKTIAVAESCTGGLLAQRLSEVPGASDYFLGGVVAYADGVKRALLDVPAALLTRHGAVSEAVARAMAEGVRRRFGADFGVATTGIAGPGGGSEEKPVGLVFVALDHGSATEVREFVFPWDRPRHRLVTSQVGLDWVRRTLLGVELLAPRFARRRRG